MIGLRVSFVRTTIYHRTDKQARGNAKSATVYDVELKKIIGDSISICFDLGSWSVLNSVAQTGKVILESDEIHKPIMVVASTAWKQKESGVINVDGILKQSGLQAHKTIENFWASDSMEKNYTCPSCGSPPCRCSVVLYFGALERF